MKDSPLARLIRARMESRGYSQAELRRRVRAELCLDVGENTVGGWITGRMPPARLLGPLSRVLGVSVEEMAKAAEES